MKKPANFWQLLTNKYRKLIKPGLTTRFFLCLLLLLKQ